MIMFLVLEEDAVTITKQYEYMLFVIQAWAISPGYFPICDRIFSPSLSLPLSVCLSLLHFLFL